jgi:hypothetical protein
MGNFPRNANVSKENFESFLVEITSILILGDEYFPFLIGGASPT